MPPDISTAGLRHGRPAPTHRLSALVRERLFGRSDVDFREPKGDPGLFGPDSVTWRVHSNPISLAVGGIAAVILELAEPRVRSGVWDHSNFRTDPLTRIRRTGQAAMITTYAPRAVAEAAVARVNRMHRRVAGTTPEGLAYHATDPELLDWVQLTASYGFLNAYLRLVGPLSVRDQDRYYAEGAKTGAAFGARTLPVSVAEADEHIGRMRPKLKPHPIIDEFLGLVSKTSPAGLPGRMVQPFVVAAAIDLLPQWAKVELKLPLQPKRAAAAALMLRGAAFCARFLRDSIPAQAYARMGRRAPLTTCRRTNAAETDK